LVLTLECMDEDLKAALFDGFDEEGDFEELDDDFVVQVPKILTFRYSYDTDTLKS
jgi:hypothetical protein